MFRGLLEEQQPLLPLYSRMASSNDAPRSPPSVAVEIGTSSAGGAPSLGSSTGGLRQRKSTAASKVQASTPFDKAWEERAVVETWFEKRFGPAGTSYAATLLPSYGERAAYGEYLHRLKKEQIAAALKDASVSAKEWDVDFIHESIHAQDPAPAPPTEVTPLTESRRDAESSNSFMTLCLPRGLVSYPAVWFGCGALLGVPSLLALVFAVLLFQPGEASRITLTVAAIVGGSIAFCLLGIGFCVWSDRRRRRSG